MMPLFLLLACASAPKTPPGPEPLSGEPKEQAEGAMTICPFESAPEACLGKRVQWEGTVPEFAHSHPMITSPSGETAVQSYIEVDESQYILLSTEPHECTGSMVAQGILGEVDLGGAPGTRGSYRNFYLSDASIRCIP